MKTRKFRESYGNAFFDGPQSDDEYAKEYKVDPKTGIPLKDKNGRPIPRGFSDDLEDLKKKLAAFGSNVKAAALEFLSGGNNQYNFSEGTELEVTDDESYDKEIEIPQTREEAIEKAKEIREQIDSVMEQFATLQIYCASNTKDRSTTGFVRSIEDSLQTAIDALEGLTNCDSGDCNCKCDDPNCKCNEPKDIEIEDPEDPLVQVTEDDDDEVDVWQELEMRKQTVTQWLKDSELSPEEAESLRQWIKGKYGADYANDKEKMTKSGFYSAWEQWDLNRKHYYNETMEVKD